jgi:hypothetical protein
MELREYRQFYDEGSALEVGELFKKNGIDFDVFHEKQSLDSLYGDREFNNKFKLRIRPENFTKADELLIATIDKEIDTVDKSHYLFQFSDEELIELLSKPDEWNPLDIQLAKKILKERGKEVSDSTIEVLKQHRISELSKPEQSSKVWIYVGYILSLLGGLIGIFMSYSIMTAKKTLPNGSKIYVYSSTDWKHGTYIFFLGVFMFIS